MSLEVTRTRSEAFRSFWMETPGTLCAALHCGTDGLASEEAGRRLVQYGPNTDNEAKADSLPRDHAAMAAQILVIFIVCPNGPPWQEFPRPALAASSLVALLGAMVLPFTPIGAWFGFETPPIVMLSAAGIIVTGYLVSAELLKPFAIKPRVMRNTTPRGPIFPMPH